MKMSYCCIVSLLISLKALCQLEPATYLTFDGIYSKRRSENIYTYYNPYICHTFGKGSYQWGIFTEAVFESENWSINPGLMFIVQGKHIYHECGIGAGFEFPRSVINGDALNAYYYIESNPDVLLAKGKWCGNINIGYAPYNWGLWHMGYIMYSIGNSCAVGIHSQRYAVTGPRLQYSVAIHGAKLTFWFASGGTTVSTGCNFVSVFKKTKIPSIVK